MSKGKNFEKLVLIFTGMTVGDTYSDLIEFRKHLTKMEKLDKLYYKPERMQFLLSDFLLMKYKI